MRLIAQHYSPITGFTEEMWWEDPPEPGKPGRVTIRRLQDVEHIVAQNKIQKNEHNRANYNDSDGFHKVATIPLGLVEQWMSEGFNWFKSTDAERRKKLNEADHKHLLVRPGRL